MLYRATLMVALIICALTTTLSAQQITLGIDAATPQGDFGERYNTAIQYTVGYNFMSYEPTEPGWVYGLELSYLSFSPEIAFDANQVGSVDDYSRVGLGGSLGYHTAVAENIYFTSTVAAHYFFDYYDFVDSPGFPESDSYQLIGITPRLMVSYIPNDYWSVGLRYGYNLSFAAANDAFGNTFITGSAFNTSIVGVHVGYYFYE